MIRLQTTTTIYRCNWCTKDAVYQDYHDNVWGKPVYDSRELFAMLTLEGAQAGLSWLTILKKKNNYFNAFDQFHIEKIANYQQDKLEELLTNSGIIRNKLKINSVIKNAKAYLALQQEQTFSEYLWKFVNHQPIINFPQKESELPAKTSLSETISKDLKSKGFTFVGPTIVYSFMQAVGMVNDHVINCSFK